MSTHSRITTPFGATSSAAAVVAGIDLRGKRAIVTGGSSGIGVETARELARAGAAVTLAVRDTEAGVRVAADIVTSTGNEEVDVMHLDLSSRESVAAVVHDWDEVLDILVNNAGIMALPELELTTGGWELQFATNHIGHFALTLGLYGALAAAGTARIVSLSSRGHLRSPVVFEDINFSSRPYDPWLAYGQSKTANILLAVEATRRWAADGITANAVHPGAIADTNLSRHMDAEALAALRSSGQFTFKSIEQGAATSVLLATSPQLEGIGAATSRTATKPSLLIPPPSCPPLASRPTHWIRRMRGGCGICRWRWRRNDPPNDLRSWVDFGRVQRYGLSMAPTAAPVTKHHRKSLPTSSEGFEAAEAEIERAMVLIGTADMAGYLQEHLGQRLTAYLAGLKDAKSVGQWAQARSEPPAITRERLRAAFHATSLFLIAYGDREAQGWFFGANSSLNDRAPAAVLREAETPAEMALIAPLARAFVRGAH